MNEDVEAVPARLPRTVLWALVFAAAMVGAGLGARWLELGPAARLLVMIPPMLLLIPLARAGERAEDACGIGSPALARYNRRALWWAFGYVAALVIAVTVQRDLHPAGPVLWLIAVLPSLPILYLVWAMACYLIEETDEYLRMRQVDAALVATGILLVVATVWGFLETFGVVPHAESWWAVAVWALGLLAGKLAGHWRRA